MSAEKEKHHYGCVVAPSADWTATAITAGVNAVGSVNRGKADSVLRAEQVQKGLKMDFS